MAEWCNLFPEQGVVDPHAIVVGDTVYLFCGHDRSWESEDNWIMDRWEIWSSTDLQNWHREGQILPEQTYIGPKPNCWAGDIAEKDGRYYWFFSNRDIDIGVMVADSITGPFRDALDKPLVPKGTVDAHCYDPDVFSDGDERILFWGNGKYYGARLAEDMLSLIHPPRPITVNGVEGVSDKSHFFKRNNLYYLVWGSKYAIADNVWGPYEYMGKFLQGGHCSTFVFNGQWYTAQVNKDIGLFYRGVQLKPLNFDRNGKVVIPDADCSYPPHGRTWDFALSTMGWHALSGTDLERTEHSTIKGTITGNAIIESPPHPTADLDTCKQITIQMANRSPARKARLHFATMDPGDDFWEMMKMKWRDGDVFEFDIRPDNNGFSKYTIDASSHPNWRNGLKRLRIEPAVGTEEGEWEIERIEVR